MSLFQLDIFGDEIELGSDEIELRQLYDYAADQSLKWWGRKFNIEIKLVNTKWRRMLACYEYSKNNEYPPVIKMSTAINKTLSKERVEKYLLHEMVHWHLHTNEIPFKDTDETFIKECLRVGAALSGCEKAKEAAKKYMNFN